MNIVSPFGYADEKELNVYRPSPPIKLQKRIVPDLNPF